MSRGPRRAHGRTLRRMVPAFLLLLATACGSPRSARPPEGAIASAPVAADPTVQRLLVDACYPCHAKEAAPPWYGRLAPSSWPSSARVVLDFSDWPDYPASRRADALRAVAAAVSGGSMPPADYTFFDGAAKLADAQRRMLARWASEQAVHATP